jgi:hypothetical protein
MIKRTFRLRADPRQQSQNFDRTAGVACERSRVAKSLAEITATNDLITQAEAELARRSRLRWTSARRVLTVEI